MTDAQDLTIDQMQLVIDSADLAIWDWRIESGELFLNARLADMLGYQLQEISPINDVAWKNIVHPNDIETVHKALRCYFKGETERYEAEFRIKTNSKKYHWFLAVGRAIERDTKGKPTRMMGVYIDRHYRKSSEQELDTKTRLLEESQRIAKVGGWELNVDSGYLYWTAET